MTEGNDNPVEAGQFLGEDGAFQEGWRDLAFPGDEGEATRNDPTLANTKDIRSMANQLISSQKTIGKMSGGRDFAILLNEQSTDEERSEFFTKCGRPSSAEGYELGKDAEQKDEKFIAKMSQSLFGAGASKSVAAAVEKAYAEYTTELAAVMDTEDKIGNAEANKQLHTILGSAYETKMASANLAIEALARPIDNEFAETLKKEMPYDVHATQFLAKIGEMIGEDKGLKAAAVESGFTPGDARAKFNELMKDPYYVTDRPKDKPFNKVYHDELITQGEKLLAIANE